MPASSLFPSSTRRQALRAGAALVGSWAVGSLFGNTRAAAAPAGASMPIGTRRVAVVGDSLTAGSMPYLPGDLSAVGWSSSTVDAYVSRGVRTKVHADRHTGVGAVAALRERFGDYPAWIVALGTNDAVIYSKSKHVDIINLMMDAIGPGHRVLWTNVYLLDKQVNQHNWNTALQETAKARDDMVVFDWAALAAANPKWVAKDGFHCTALGYEQRSAALAMATRAMLPNDDSFWLMPGHDGGVRLFPG